MPTMHGGGHHHFFRIRKKQYQLLPSGDDLRKFLDKTIYLVGLAGPAMTIPQLMTIWGDKNVGGLVLSSWGTYLFVAFFWLTYGILHKVKPIIVVNSCWIVIHSLMVAGLLLYG